MYDILQSLVCETIQCFKQLIVMYGIIDGSMSSMEKLH